MGTESTVQVQVQ